MSDKVAQSRGPGREVDSTAQPVIIEGNNLKVSETASFTLEEEVRFEVYISFHSFDSCFVSIDFFSVVRNFVDALPPQHTHTQTHTHTQS